MAKRTDEELLAEIKGQQKKQAEKARQEQELLKARERKLVKRIQDKQDKERIRRQFEIGALVESVFGQEYPTKEDREDFQRRLIKLLELEKAAAGPTGTVPPKPILFNTLMVQAILDGRKTQTRRFAYCGDTVCDDKIETPPKCSFFGDLYIPTELYYTAVISVEAISEGVVRIRLGWDEDDDDDR